MRETLLPPSLMNPARLLTDVTATTQVNLFVYSDVEWPTAQHGCVVGSYFERQYQVHHNYHRDYHQQW